MKKHKITLAVASVLLSTGATSAMAAETYYNTFTTPFWTNTDGWTRIHDGNGDGYGTGPASQGNKGLIVPWAGTPGNKLPFDYAGSSHLNWAVQLVGEGDTAVISGADSLSRYGFTAEIDTGGGAWLDNGRDAQGNPTTGGPTGWRHQTDIGLIRSDTTQFVHLNLTALGQQLENTFSRFGVTIFEGMDTNTGNYSHHGGWNAGARPIGSANPFDTTGLDTVVSWSDNVDSVNSIKFLAQADTIYSIYLGGVGFARWNQAVDDYRLDITTSPVPVPAAVWFFGTALAGLMGFNRRNKATA